MIVRIESPLLRYVETREIVAVETPDGPRADYLLRLRGHLRYTLSQEQIQPVLQVLDQQVHQYEAQLAALDSGSW